MDRFLPRSKVQITKRVLIHSHDFFSRQGRGKGIISDVLNAGTEFIEPELLSFCLFTWYPD